MAFLFGSYAKGTHTVDSDIDVAVYFNPEGHRIEWEETKIHWHESEIWSAIEKITAINTDFVVLNRAPAHLAFAVITEGIPIIIKDPAYYLRFYLCISSAAEDFRQFINDYYRIKQRSTSLSEIDRTRLINIINFLKTELNDYHKFKTINLYEYEHDSDQRRNLERWVENIVNASIDVAKILLASHHKKIPQTYRLILQDLVHLEGFAAEMATQLSYNSRLRNILAHEYLDIRFSQIKDFLQNPEIIYGYLINYSDVIIARH